MTNTGHNDMSRADLERLLDVYGSDRSRWPLDARTSAGQLVTRDKAARRLLAEAEALDRIMEHAPLPSLASEAALVERIVAAAQRTPRIVRLGETREDPSAAVEAPSADNVIRWPGARTGQQWLRSGPGRVAGVLAACLMFGIYIGLSNVGQGAIENITGLTLGSSTTVAQLDLDEDLL